MYNDARFVFAAIFVLLLSPLAEFCKAKPERVEAKFHNHELRCWEGWNESGDSVILQTNARDLRDYSFNNRAASCRFKGIWILYDYFNYNRGYFGGKMHLGWGDNYYVNFDGQFTRKASSARPVAGVLHSFRADSLSIFAGEYFMGKQRFYTGTADFLPRGFGQSAIVTGCSAWTLYTGLSGSGPRICLLPADTLRCDPGFFPLTGDLGGVTGRILSISKGCYANRKIEASRNFDGLLNNNNESVDGILPRLIQFNGFIQHAKNATESANP